MAVIDSNKFITNLVWSGLIDKATCGELKEAIELCTVKDTFSKSDIVAMLTEIQSEIEEMQSLESECDYAIDECIYKCRVTDLIQEKINALKEEKDDKERGNVSNE